MPTTNYKNIKLSYAAELSSAGKGVSAYSYSLDSGLTYITSGLLVNGLAASSYTPGVAWATVNIDFSSIPGVNNNPKFVFRIINSVTTATTTSGNSRFDNIALQGDTINAGPLYTVVATDASGCTSAPASVTITQPALLTTTVSVNTNVTCFGGNNGAAIANVSGGNTSFTYTWSPSGGNAATGSNLQAGNYVVNVTDNKGCAASGTVSITQPAAAVTASVSSVANVSCYGGSNGTATVTANGGTPVYTYTWLPTGGNTTVGNNLTAGTYTLNVTDTKGCAGSTTVSISQANAMTVSITTFTNVTCNGNSNGAATAGPIGGSGNYSYQWDDANNQTTATASGLSAGIYNCYVKDVTCGTLATNSVSINQPNLMTVVASGSQVNCHGAATGNATVTASFGSGIYSYQWNDVNNQTTATANNLIAGTYTCVVKDVSCNTTVTSTISITQPGLMTASIIGSANATCNGTATGSSTVTASLGSGTYTYQWNDANNQTSAIANNLIAGTYTCLVKDVTCNTTVTNTVNISQPGLMTAIISNSTNATCNGTNNGSATVTASSGSGSYSYQWNDAANQTSAIASNLLAGTYTCVVKDVTCNTTITNTINISQLSLMTASITASTNVDCNGNGNGSATALASLGSGVYAYQWNDLNDQTTATAGNLTAGTYTCIVNDVTCGTTIINTVTIAQPNTLVLDSIKIKSGNNVIAYASGGISIGSSASYTYSWTPGGVTTATLSNAAPGNYTVCVTSGSGCGTVCGTVFVPGTTGITSVAAANEVKIYPVPSNGEITVELDNADYQLMKIYDNAGKEVFSQLLTGSNRNNTMKIDLSNQSNSTGIFMLQVITSNGLVINKRIIILNN